MTSTDGMSGSIHADFVNEVSTRLLHSDFVVIAGCKWSLNYGFKSSDSPFFADISFQHASYSAEVDVELTIRVEFPNSVVVAQEVVTTLSGTTCERKHVFAGLPDFENPPIQYGDRVQVRADIVVRRTSGFRRMKFLAFDSPETCGEPSSDVTFVVGPESKKFYASSQILARASPVLEAMFAGNFKEAQDKEVRLEDESPEAFADFLRCVYLCGNTITKSTIDGVIHLVNYYDVDYVAEACEKWYAENYDSFTVEELLAVVVKHEFQSLLEWISHRLTRIKMETVMKDANWKRLPAEQRLKFVEDFVIAY